jgi:hypothetical protein
MTIAIAPNQNALAESAALTALANAHDKAIRTSAPEIARYFQDLVGQKLTAYMTGVNDPKAVGKWASGQRAPRGESERRLRDAYQIAMLISAYDSDSTVRAWLVGMNPLLGDRAPAAVLAEREDGAVQALAAAKAFLANG